MPGQVHDARSRTAELLLVRDAQAGDVAALGVLLDRYRPEMLAVALGALGRPSDAEDAVQEAMLTALGRIQDLRDPGAIGPWLKMIVRNCCRMHVRANLPVPVADQLPVPRLVEAADPALLLEDHAARDWVWHAVEQLSEPLRHLDPVLLWTVAATATSRVRLNSSTLSTFYYEPPHLARLLTTLDVLSGGRLEVGVGLGWMKDEHDIARSADWHQRGQILDDLLAFLHAWWTANPVCWDSQFFSMPPTHADLRPVQAGGPPIWIGGASEAAMRRVGRSAVGWLAFEGLPDDVVASWWSIARRAAEDAMSRSWNVVPSVIRTRGAGWPNAGDS